MSSEQNTSDLIEVEVQDSAQTGGISTDSRFWWLLFVIVVGGFTLVVTYSRGHPLYGAALDLALLVLAVVATCLPWFGGGHVSLAGALYRKIGYRRRAGLGVNYHVSQAIAAGELAEGTELDVFRDYPDLFGDIKVVPVPYEDIQGEFWGAIQDRNGPNRSYSGCIRAVGTRPMFDNVSEPWKRRLAFANLLDLASRSGIDRIAWEDVTEKGEDLQPEAALQRLRSQSGLTSQSPEGDAELIDIYKTMGAESVVHKTTFTLSIMEGRKRSKEISEMGGWERVLYDRLEKFSKLAGATGVGIDQRPILDYNDLVIAMRKVWDPEAAQRLELWLPEHPGQLLPDTEIWPATHDFQPKFWRGDGCWHVALYVSNFSAAMFGSQHWRDVLREPVEKTVKVVAQPIPTRESTKNAIRNTTNAKRAISDRPATRRVTEPEALALETRQRQERRAVRSPHFEMSLRVYIDIRGKTLDEVKDSATRVLSKCDGAGFVVLDMEYIQHLNTSAMLYAARGLSGKRGSKE